MSEMMSKGKVHCTQTEVPHGSLWHSFYFRPYFSLFSFALNYSLVYQSK
jgi:hypothetical protein